MSSKGQFRISSHLLLENTTWAGLDTPACNILSFGIWKEPMSRPNFFSSYVFLFLFIPIPCSIDLVMTITHRVWIDYSRGQASLDIRNRRIPKRWQPGSCMKYVIIAILYLPKPIPTRALDVLGFRQWLQPHSLRWLWETPDQPLLRFTALSLGKVPQRISSLFTVLGEKTDWNDSD